MSNEPHHIISTIAGDWNIQLPIQQNEWIKALEERINYLLVHDFDKLISLLYRIDVNEKKLKEQLQANNTEDAGKIIAALVIERQLQKIKSRKEFTAGNNDIPDDEEKW